MFWVVAQLHLLVGLGNPGLKYKLTRHNAGFLVVDQIARKCGINFDRKDFDCVYGTGKILDREILLAKPQTFMNLSGQAVVALVNYFKFKLNQVLIIADDLDLPLGTVRLKLSGSSGGQKGLTSVINLLGTNQIPRLRIGIGRSNDIPVIDYVLTPFAKNEQPVFQAAVMLGAEAALSFITESPEFAMNHYNGTVEKLKPFAKNQPDDLT